jgi:hypothetical protein
MGFPLQHSFSRGKPFPAIGGFKAQHQANLTWAGVKTASHRHCKTQQPYKGDWVSTPTQWYWLGFLSQPSPLGGPNGCPKQHWSLLKQLSPLTQPVDIPPGNLDIGEGAKAASHRHFKTQHPYKGEGVSTTIQGGPSGLGSASYHTQAHWEDIMIAQTIL